MKWLINFDCAHWCGGDSYVVVTADSEADAIDKASDFMQEEMWNLFSDEYNDSDDEYYKDYSNEQCFNVISCKEFDENHEQWGWYKDPEQSQFYPEIE